MVRPQISSEAPLPGYVLEVGRRSGGVKRGWKGQPQAPAKYFIKSHSCAAHEERDGGAKVRSAASGCVRACAPTISFDAVVNAERCAGQKNAALWKYLFMYFIHDRTDFGISCGYTTESKSREKKRGRKIRGVIRAAAPGPCDCVESVNPIGSGALGSGNPSVLRLEQVLTERERVVAWKRAGRGLRQMPRQRLFPAIQGRTSKASGAHLGNFCHTSASPSHAGTARASAAQPLFFSGPR